MPARPPRSPQSLGIIRRSLRCAALLLLGGISPAAASVYSSNGSWTSSSLTVGSFEPTPPPSTAGSYWSSAWQVEAWPGPLPVGGKVVAPVASLTVAVQADAPAALHLGVGDGEFYLLDKDRHVHVASGQRPEQWKQVDAPPAAEGMHGFNLLHGVTLLTPQGFVAADPGPTLLAPRGEEPALSPPYHAICFAPRSTTAVLPGTTYRWREASNGIARQFSSAPNTGLTLPRFFGDTPHAPLRAHSLKKIVQGSSVFYALGELHPDTPGYAPGTQAVFKSKDLGTTWVFQALPMGPGRWQDIAAAYSHWSDNVPNPAEAQLVLVGEGGIYTTLDDGKTWLHLPTNTTTANAAPLPLALPERTDAPINESLPLRLNTVVWARDRFIAAGSTRDGNGRTVFLEGLSKYWFAYPILGWPGERSVDQIVAYQNRRVLLSNAAGPSAPALLATDVPVFAADSEGSAPVLSSPPVVYPELGTWRGPLIHPQSMNIRRYIVTSDSIVRWGVGHARLHPPYVTALGSVYLVDDQPARLTIIAINEYGRSAPLEVEIQPTLPTALWQDTNAPLLSTDREVRAPYGARVHIPVKQLNKHVPWDSKKSWFYGLPDGTRFDPGQSAIIGHALEPGTHRVDILSIKGNSVCWSRPLTLHIPEPKPKAPDAGLFAGVLEGPEPLAGAWTLSLRPDRTFTGKIRLTHRSHAFRGTLIPEPGLTDTFAASVTIPRKRLPPLQVELILHASEGHLSLRAGDGTNESFTNGGTVSNAPWAKDRHASRAGYYVAAIRLEQESQPAPAGIGFLQLNVSNLGQASLRGELANGLKWTASAPLDDAGTIPVFSSAKGRVLLGALAFDQDTVSSTSFRGDLRWSTTVIEKCPVYGATATVKVIGDTGSSTAWRGDRLPRGRHNLKLSHTGQMGLVAGSASAIFDTYERQPVFARGHGETNPLQITLHLKRSTSLAKGSFTPSPLGIRMRSATLRGAAVTDSESGKTYLVGYFLLPAADGKSLISGEITSTFLGF